MRLSLPENISIEDETILSKCTNEHSDDGTEQSNILDLRLKTEREVALLTDVRNSIKDLSFDNNFELSSEAERFISFENSDLSILMKTSNSAISRKDTFKHLYKLNFEPLSINNETSNSAKRNLALSIQDLKLDKSHCENFCISSLNETNNTEKSISGSNRTNESQQNSVIWSSFENESPEKYINEKKNKYMNKTNYIKLRDQQNSFKFSDSESRKKNIIKNQLKHCEVKLFDYLVEQEMYNSRHFEKNELIDVYNKINSTKKKGNINNSISEKSHWRNNLMKNRSVIENNKENITEFFNYFRKCTSLEYKLDKSNLYHYADNSLRESNKKLLDNEKVTKQDVKEDQNNNEKTKVESNEESIKKNDKNNKRNHNIYSKFGKCNKSKLDVKMILEKISETKTILGNVKIEDVTSSTTYESDNSSNSENDIEGDISDRVSSRLRNMHRLKPICTRRKSLPKQITEESIKKVVQNITLTPISSKNNITINKALKEKKSKTIINNIDIRYNLRKVPQSINYENQIKKYVKVVEMRKFLMSKLIYLSKTNALLDCEDIIQRVNTAVRNAQSKKPNINTIITTLKELLYEKDICKNFVEFYTFISNFTPFSFQKKVMPLGGAFGCNGPKVTKKLADPLR